MDISNYNRREKGTAKVTNQEWEKLSKLLEMPGRFMITVKINRRYWGEYDTNCTKTSLINIIRNIIFTIMVQR